MTAAGGHSAPPLRAGERVLPPARYDAVLLSSFGGPEGQDDVIPFLRNVTRGRGIPEERLEEVAHHYRANGGVSPINEQNRRLRDALQAELDARGLGLPVYWGNRNWGPYFADALREAHAAGHDSLLALVTSAYSGYSSCRQYREDLAGALAETGLGGVMRVDKVRQFFDHPGFVEPFVEGTRAALARLREAGHPRPHVMFVTHSVPVSAADASGPREALPDGSPVPGGQGGGWYAEQHRAVAGLVMDAVADGHPGLEWSLVYQSRSGDPRTPWLEPDINDAIGALPADAQALVVVPIGFVSDHMEVVWDLDTEAVATAAARGLPMERVPTPGVAPAFVAGLADLVEERLAGRGGGRAHLSGLGPWQDVCPSDCCLGTTRLPVVAEATPPSDAPG